MEELLNIQIAKKSLLSGEISCEKLIELYILNLENENKKYNIYVRYFKEDAIKKAKELDLKIKNKEKTGKLLGGVFSIKDNICIKDKPMTASSRILENYISPFNSTVVERIIKEDGIIIGMTNCDQFGMGSSTENSIYGSTKNPLNPQKTCGGSSGGSAASILIDSCNVAIGTDTGGSIRQPASFCGIYGLKPTYSRISRYGLTAFASSFDQAGILSKNINNVALTMEVLAGFDKNDLTSSKHFVDNYTDFTKNSNYNIAFFQDFINYKELDNNIYKSLINLKNKLDGKSQKTQFLNFGLLDALISTYYILTSAEASSNLSRFSGMFYGYRTKKEVDIDNIFIKNRSEGFGKEVKKRIMLGTFVLSYGYYDAYYEKAQKVRRILVEKIEEVFKEYNFIIIPTTPTSAFNLDEMTKDDIKTYYQDIYTTLASITGMPAINIPFGNNAENMPFGIQIIAPKFREKDLLTFSNYIKNEII